MLSRNKSVKNTKLQMENLENRNLMAGDVGVSVIGGTLLLVGDADANGVQIVSGEEPGQYIVSGVDAGGEATSLNGDFSEVVVDGVDRNIKLYMGRGDDTVNIPNLKTEGRVAVRTGTGDDVVTIGGEAADEALVDITGGLTVNLGAGDDTAMIAGTAARWMRVVGRTGDDTMDISNSRVRRGIWVNGHTGEDTVRVSNVDGTRLHVRGGADDDTVEITDSVFRSIGVRMLEGDDALSIHGTSAKRVRLGGGTDTDSLTTDLKTNEYRAVGFETVEDGGDPATTEL